MKTSLEGVKFIAGWEGLLLKAEIDYAATPKAAIEAGTPPLLNIGYGHTDAAGPPPVVEGMVITEEEALSILASDLKVVEKRVSNVFGAFQLEQHQFDAAVSFDYNTGGIEEATWVKKFKAHDPNGTSVWLMKWNKAGGREVLGLTKRRRAELNLLLNANYGEGP